MPACRAALTAMTCFTLTACGSTLPRGGDPLHGFDAAEIIWQFFERQHRGL